MKNKGRLGNMGSLGEKIFQEGLSFQGVNFPDFEFPKICISQILNFWDLEVPGFIVSQILSFLDFETLVDSPNMSRLVSF